MLTNEQIEKFQMLYKNRFGKDITKEEAYEKAVKLIRMVEIVYRPMTEAEYKKLDEWNEATKDLLN